VTVNTSELGGRFRSAALAADFLAAYQAMADRWPAGTARLDVAGPYGTTRVLACGPADAPPVLLLPGHGATATVWFGVAGPLSRHYRVYAGDVPGDAGASVPGARPMRAADDFMTWLDELLDGLGASRAALAGHSYGGWLALEYARHAPARVTRLALVDPTDCFTGLSLAYRLRAIPLLARPTAARARRLIAWETAGAALDPQVLDLLALAGGEYRGARVVLPSRPTPAQLTAVTMPVLVVVAGRSRAHDPARLADRARATLTDVTTVTMPNVAHHALPYTDAPELARHLAALLA
jgi:pimeloyl-ACP methyl ester carboxylesterase